MIGPAGASIAATACEGHGSGGLDPSGTQQRAGSERFRSVARPGPAGGGHFRASPSVLSSQSLRGLRFSHGIRKLTAPETAHRTEILLGDGRWETRAFVFNSTHCVVGQSVCGGARTDLSPI